MKARRAQRVLIASPCPSISALRKARLSLLPFVTPRRRAPPLISREYYPSQLVTHIINSYWAKKMWRSVRCSPSVPRAPGLAHLLSHGCGIFYAILGDGKRGKEPSCLHSVTPYFFSFLPLSFSHPSLFASNLSSIYGLNFPLAFCWSWKH